MTQHAMTAERYAELCRLRHRVVSGSPEMHDIDRQVREAGWPPIYRDPAYIAKIGCDDKLRSEPVIPVSTPEQMAAAYREQIGVMIEFAVTYGRPKLSDAGRVALAERCKIVAEWAAKRGLIERQLIERVEREAAGAAKTAAALSGCRPPLEPAL